MGDPMALDWPLLLNRGTALVWVLLAAYGVFRRVRRLQRLNQIILPEPVEQEDVEYLASIKRSTYLRMGVKIVLLIGGCVALFNLMGYVLIWRFGVLLMLVFMDTETASVDRIRERLALSAQAREGQE